MTEISVAFRHDHPAKHPFRRTSIHRIEITEVPEAPSAADSSIARFAPALASLTRDASGVMLRIGGDEIVYPWAMIGEARNVPRAK